MAADDDEELFLSAYLVEEEEDDAVAAAKAEREKRREAGDWDMERILEKSREQTREIIRQHREELNRLHEELRINDVGDDQKKQRAAPPQMPMRHYAACLGGPELASSANVLAVRVVRSAAAGYPVDVYGHVFVRDDLDGRRVYLFRRSRDNFQRINSKDEVLTLTGPSRGLLLRRDIHFEINLKSKSHRAEDDREIARCYLKNQVTTSTYKVVRNRVDGRHCNIDLTYVPVHQAVEATFELKIDEILTTTRVSRRGNGVREWLPFSEARKEHHPEFLFRGKVTAGISGVWEDMVVLYDSEADGTVATVSDNGFIQLSRRVVSWPFAGTSLSLKVTPGEYELTSFYASLTGCHSFVLRNTSYKLSGKVTWSTLYSPKVDGLASSWFPQLECFSESA